jgi:two-component system phosphate regulon sensor histidine kinase PhoR
MSLALIGTIVVQIFWVKNSVQNLEADFSRDVHKTLEEVAKSTERQELIDFNVKLSNITRDKTPSEADIRSLIFEQIDTLKNEKFVFAQTILEQKYKLPTEILMNDSLTFQRTFSKKDYMVTKTVVGEDATHRLPMEDKKTIYEELKDMDLEILKSAYYVYSSRIPLHMRVNADDMERKLSLQLQNKGITTPFKYAIYDKGMLTSVKSGFFTLKKGKTYYVPMFLDSKGNSNYRLYVSFPEKQSFIFSGIAKNLLLSLIFTLTIIGVFATTLYQLKRQKQISEIKTDFINNMTHEFKTPIATINLALDAIKNPQIIGDEEKVKSYVNMIRQENKRMHAQVETVLRISKLDKNQLRIEKEVVDIHEILEDAISHVQLLIEDRDGTLKLAMEAIQTEVLGNAFHLTNIFINILDNAIKYSPNKLDISVKTENTAGSVLVQISDKGSGMSKQALKHIFEDFYREEGGNIHNVKGHGLGLSYVKKIVELHDGKILADSEKGKGSTFSVKLKVI